MCFVSARLDLFSDRFAVDLEKDIYKTKKRSQRCGYDTNVCCFFLFSFVLANKVNFDRILIKQVLAFITAGLLACIDRDLSIFDASL